MPKKQQRRVTVRFNPKARYPTPTEATNIRRFTTAAPAPVVPPEIKNYAETERQKFLNALAENTPYGTIHNTRNFLGENVGKPFGDFTSGLFEGPDLFAPPDENTSLARSAGEILGLLPDASDLVTGAPKAVSLAAAPFSVVIRRIKQKNPDFKYLVHGSPVADKIAAEGFDYTKHKISDLHGWMAHFSERPAYSDDYATKFSSHREGQGYIPVELDAERVLDVYNPDPEDIARIYSAAKQHSGDLSARALKEKWLDVYRRGNLNDAWELPSKESSIGNYLTHYLRDNFSPEEVAELGFDAIRYDDYGERAWAVPDPSVIRSALSGVPIGGTPYPHNRKVRFLLNSPESGLGAEEIKPRSVKHIVPIRENAQSAWPVPEDNPFWPPEHKPKFDNPLGKIPEDTKAWTGKETLSGFDAKGSDQRYFFVDENNNAYLGTNYKPPSLYPNEGLVLNPNWVAQHKAKTAGANPWENWGPHSNTPVFQGEPEFSSYLSDEAGEETKKARYLFTSDSVSDNKVFWGTNVKPSTLNTETNEKVWLNPAWLTAHGYKPKQLPSQLYPGEAPEVKELADQLFSSGQFTNAEEAIDSAFKQLEAAGKVNIRDYELDELQGVEPLEKLGDFLNDKPVKSQYDKDIEELDNLFAGVQKAKWNLPSLEEALKKVPGVPANLGGMHLKEILDVGGSKFIFKSANGPKFVPMGEVTASKIAKHVHPNVPDVGLIERNGMLGTYQEAVDNKLDYPTLRDVGIDNLTQKDIDYLMESAALDWIIGNHDAHSGQFLVTPNGLVEIDRGQAFKFFEDDNIGFGSHPNEAYGEEPPIWQLLKESGKFDKDTLAEAAISAADKVRRLIIGDEFKPNDMSQIITEYIRERYPNDHKKQVDFINRFWNRVHDTPKTVWKYFNQ